MYFLFVVILTCLLVRLGSGAVEMSITPHQFTATTEKEVVVSCLAQVDSDDDVRKISTVEISREDDVPLAFLRDCSNVSYGAGLSDRFKAKGYMEEDFSKSFLSLTVWNPTSLDSGLYKCAVYFVDQVKQVSRVKASASLKVESLNIKSLEAMFIQLRDKISTLEIENKRLTKELHEKDSTLKTTLAELNSKVTSLETTNKEDIDELSAKVQDLDEIRKQQIYGLTDKVNHVMAFSVTNQHVDIKSSKNQILVLPDIIMLRGEGFDPRTSTLSAPRHGLYVFHVSILTSSAGCTLRLYIQKNNDGVASLFVKDKTEPDQSSVSTVLELKTGDKVNLYQADGKCNLFRNLYTRFTGYLIQAF